jgi:hypothetical protein
VHVHRQDVRTLTEQYRRGELETAKLDADYRMIGIADANVPDATP